MRSLIEAALDDEELTTLAFDHFREVYERFAGGMSKSQKIQVLIEHCERKMRIPELLANMKTANPAQYAKFFPEQNAQSSKNESPEIQHMQPHQTLLFTISEDGRPILNNTPWQQPLSEFDPHFLELDDPSGAVKLSDRLYIEREADARLKRQLTRAGSTTVIRSPRQTGKTSLLMRGIHYVREQRQKVVFVNFQGWDREFFASMDTLLREVAQYVRDELELRPELLEQAWLGERGAAQKLRWFLETEVLSALDKPMVIAMDEADSLRLKTTFYDDFFGMLRSWHDLRAFRNCWNKLNLVLVVSTEPDMLIKEVHQSPFNVGLELELADFNIDQVRDLNRRHGSPVQERDLTSLMNLLSGHPYLTRLALYTMVIDRVTWAELARNSHTESSPFSRHLRYQYRIIHDQPDLKKALKEIIRGHDCSDEVSRFRLLQSGLVKENNNGYTCRCELYKSYFRDHLL